MANDGICHEVELRERCDQTQTRNSNSRKMEKERKKKDQSGRLEQIAGKQGWFIGGKGQLVEAEQDSRKILGQAISCATRCNWRGGGNGGGKKIPPPPTQLKRYLFRGRKKKRRKRTIKRGKSIFHISSVKLSGFFFIFLYVSWLKKFFTYTR